MSPAAQAIVDTEPMSVETALVELRGLVEQLGRLREVSFRDRRTPAHVRQAAQTRYALQAAATRVAIARLEELAAPPWVE